MSSPTRSASFSGSYESSEYEHDTTTRLSNGTKETNREFSYQKPKPYSDQKHVNGNGGSKQARPTHFLCFPLVTNESVPQLAKSLERFRDLTTVIPAAATNGLKSASNERETPDREAEPEHSTEDPGAVTGAMRADLPGLKVIPVAAHRPPGTFHFTIGAIDLSEKSNMQKAIRLLKSIDFEATLKELESIARPPTNGHAQKEISMDANRPEISNSSSSTLDGNQTPKQASPQTNLYGQTGYRETVSRIDRAILHATPDSPVMRQQKSITKTNGHTSNGTQSSPLKNTATTNSDAKFKPNNFGKTSHLNDNTNANLYGVSGYKETVSTVDRYVDKTYARAQKVKEMVQLKKGPLKSLRRNVSPPASLASRQRLISVDSHGGSGDGGSLYTTTSAGTARPSVASPTEVADTTKPTTPAAAPASTQTTLSAAPTPAPQTTTSQPFYVTLQGINAFSSPHKARVFYAPPLDPDGRLLAFANAIRQVFKDEGLITEDRELTLHATVANMTYVSNIKLGRVGGRGGRERRKGRPVTVDGSEVIRMFNAEEVVWARDVRVDRVRICKMGAERSEDQVLGMVYRAVEVDVDGEGKEKAEVVFA